MAEAAEDVYARIKAAAGSDGRLASPPSTAWDIFPWEAADGGGVVPRVLPPPSDEPLRAGDSSAKPCGVCSGFAPENVVWEDDDWVVTHPGEPSGLPVVLMLYTRRHLDFGELDDDMAAAFGRISNRLVRVLESLPNIGRAHMMRYGDGSSHLHIHFFARTARLTNVLGSPAMEWDDVIPPAPEDVWRADLRAVSAQMSAGEDRAESAPTA